MKERPILFSGPMVRAIREDRKTMTRRVIKGANPYTECGLSTLIAMGSIKCPHGKTGDLLWVRETFCDRDNSGDLIKPLYRADGNEYEDSDGWTFEPKWKPSIFMPRKYSRNTLEITKIRVERLQDITEEDALNEGIIMNADGFFFASDSTEVHHFLRQPHLTAKGAFNTLWESINGPGSWDENPWVWVEEFKRVQK